MLSGQHSADMITMKLGCGAHNIALEAGCIMVRWRVIVVLLVVAGLNSAAIAQSYTDNAVSNIRSSSIGSGYSVSSLNTMDLSQVQLTVPYVGQSTDAGARRAGSLNINSDLGLSPSSGSKPFSNVHSPPAVSPYLNLFRTDFESGGDLNYQTLVRPQLEQQQFNQQVTRENLRVNRRLQQLSARSPFRQQGSRDQLPTGHQTAFFHYGHYYPRLR